MKKIGPNKNTMKTGCLHTSVHGQEIDIHWATPKIYHEY